MKPTPRPHCSPPTLQVARVFVPALVPDRLCLVAQRALRPRIDGQRGGGAAMGRIEQARLQHLLHPDMALARLVDIAQHVRGERALRVEALFLTREFKRRFAKRKDLVGFFGQDAAAQVAGLARLQPRHEIGVIGIGEDAEQRARHFLGRLDQRRTAFAALDALLAE